MTYGERVHAEPELEPPQCCAHAMVKAFAEVIGEGNTPGETARNHSERASAVIEGRKKPR